MRLRISRSAQADTDRIVAESADRWGTKASERYAAMLKSAMRKIAAAPTGPTTRSRADLSPGIRSLHTAHVRTTAGASVKNPVHVIYFRVIAHELVDVLRILHQRMDPSRHLDLGGGAKPPN